MFVFDDMFGSVFDFGDVFGSTRFESHLQSDNNKQLFCNLVMLINCNTFSVLWLEACFILVTCLGVCTCSPRSKSLSLNIE